MIPRTTSNLKKGSESRFRKVKKGMLRRVARRRLGERQDLRLGNPYNRALRFHIESANGFDLVSEKLDA